MENTKQRHGCVNAWLWLVILVNIILFIFYAYTVFRQSSAMGIWGMGILSSLSLFNVLGSILLLRWNKCGFYLMVIVAVLATCCNLFLLHNSPVNAVTSLLGVGFWFAILQIHKDGVSAWSLMDGGLDWKHCRHLYQVFLGVAVVILVATAFRVKGSNPVAETQSEEIASDAEDELEEAEATSSEWITFYSTDRECSMEAPHDFRKADLNKDQVLGVMCSDYDPAAVVISEPAALLKQYGIKTSQDYANLILKNNTNVEGASDYEAVSAKSVGNNYLIVYNLTLDGTKYQYYLYATKTNQKFYYALVFCLYDYAKKLQPVMEHMAKSLKVIEKETTVSTQSIEMPKGNRSEKADYRKSKESH